MFERMEMEESIYEGVVEPSYKKPTREDSNHAGHSRKNRGEAALSWNITENGEINCKRRKSYVDIPTGESKPVSYMATYILQKNVRSWGTSELNMLRVDLLRTRVKSPYPEKK